jgi:hypothetical protein
MKFKLTQNFFMFHLHLNSPTRLVYAILFGLSLLMAASSAQEISSSEEGTEVESNTIRSLAVGFEDGLRELHILDAGMRSVGTTRLVLCGYSRPFIAPVVNGRINFGVEAGLNEENLMTYQVVASVPWSASYSERALVFIPKSFANNPELTQPYVVRPMDMSQKNFKPSTTKVVNFTPITAYILVGEHRAVVEAGKVFNIPEVTEVLPGNMALLNVYNRIDGEVNTVIETRFRYLDRMRYLIVVYPDFVNQKMGVAAIVDSGGLY